MILRVVLFIALLFLAWLLAVAIYAWRRDARMIYV